MSNHLRIGIFSLALAIFGVVALAPPASAASFNAGRIIDDSVFTNTNTMTVDDITRFLNAKGTYCIDGEAPCLKNFTENGLTSAQIIYNAAKQYGINPQSLIATLQKEVGLVTKSQPGSWRYTTAMGYGCPDSTPGVCSASYYGFTNQMNNASRRFRELLNGSPSNYIIGANFVLWNPNTSCGGSTINIVNHATRALYTYTPYQPNAAALAAGYGEGDGCSAYGNRNFFNYFTDWFGSTYNSLQYVQVEGGNGQYILYDGKKQALTYDALFAWDITRLPLTTMTSSQLNGIPDTGSPLTPYAVVAGTNSKVFADSGVFYDINDGNAQTWGGFKGYQQSSVGWAVLNNVGFGHDLPFVVSIPNDTRQFFMEGGTLYPVSSPSVIRAWNGYNSIALSSYYAQGLPIGQTVYSNLITSGPNTYLVDGGRGYIVPSQVLNLLSSVPKYSVSAASLGRYANQGNLSAMVSNSSGDIFALDSGTRRHITNYEVYSALRSPSAQNPSSLGNDALDLIPLGAAFSTAIVNQPATSKNFLIDNGIRAIDASMFTEYGLSNNVAVVSQQFIDLYAESSPASQFIKNRQGAGVYFVSEGKKIPITRYDVLVLLNGQNAVTEINSSDFNAIPTSSAVMSPILTVGASGLYGIADKGSFFTTSASSSLSSWKAGTITNVSQATFDRLQERATTKASLSSHIQTEDGWFCNIDITKSCADRVEMIYMWKLLDGVIHPSNDLINYFGIQSSGYLSVFVSSPAGTTYEKNVFAMIDGKLYYVSTPTTLWNLGYSGYMSRISPGAIDSLNTGKLMNGYLFKDSSSQLWVIDAAGKRLVPSQYASNWTGPQATPMDVSNYFVNIYNRRNDISRSVTRSGPGIIYGLDQGVKRGITTYEKYSLSWTSYTPVSDALISLLPDGPTI